MNFQETFKLKNIPLEGELMSLLFNQINVMVTSRIISSISLELRTKNKKDYLIIRIYQGDRCFSSKKFYFETQSNFDWSILKIENFAFFDFDEKSCSLTISTFDTLEAYPKVEKIDFYNPPSDETGILLSIPLKIRIDFSELEDFMNFLNYSMRNHSVSAKIRYLKHHNFEYYKNHFKISLCYDNCEEPLLSFTVGVCKDSFPIEKNYLLSQYNFLSLGNYELKKTFSYCKLFDKQTLTLNVHEPENKELSQILLKQLEWLKS